MIEMANGGWRLRVNRLLSEKLLFGPKAISLSSSTSAYETFERTMLSAHVLSELVFACKGVDGLGETSFYIDIGDLVVSLVWLKLLHAALTWQGARWPA